MEENKKREAAAMASNSCPRPHLKTGGVTQDQLSKFRELQRRRLQLSLKSKNKRKPKGSSVAKIKRIGEDLDMKGSLDENTAQELTDSSVSDSSTTTKTSASSLQVDVHPVLKKKKLHWGLDTKERWERKANM